jgi:hypothetical protein
MTLHIKIQYTEIQKNIRFVKWYKYYLFKSAFTDYILLFSKFRISKDQHVKGNPILVKREKKQNNNLNSFVDTTFSLGASYI